ncbi:hypothetical protein [Methylobacterium trifolii]|nr:hypothetical protein [Methylobacterium trifolii]
MIEDIRRAAHRQASAGDTIRIVPEILRGEDGLAVSAPAHRRLDA